MTPSTKRRALITGASSGIGKATALAFAEAGIDLVLVSRDSDRLTDVAIAAQQKGVEARVYPLDLAQVDQIATQMMAIATEAGPIDILVNNAGMGYTGALMATSLKDWQRVIDLNLTSVFQCIQGILPTMRDRQQGVIINISSIAASQGFPDWGVYSVSKAGLVALSRVLAAEEQPHGIRVMIISPGAVNTSLWDTDTVQADFGRDMMLTPDVVAQTILHAALLPNNATVQELTITPSAGAL